MNFYYDFYYESGVVPSFILSSSMSVMSYVYTVQYLLGSTRPRKKDPVLVQITPVFPVKP